MLWDTEKAEFTVHTVQFFQATKDSEAGKEAQTFPALEKLQ